MKVQMMVGLLLVKMMVILLNDHLLMLYLLNQSLSEQKKGHFLDKMGKQTCLAKTSEKSPFLELACL